VLREVAADGEDQVAAHQQVRRHREERHHDARVARHAQGGQVPVDDAAVRDEKASGTRCGARRYWARVILPWQR